MAVCGHIRRKLHRLLNVRSVLLAVPLIWIMFVLWTVYYTQFVEKAQSQRQLVLSAVHKDYIEAQQYNNNKMVKHKHGTHANDIRKHATIKNVVQSPFLDNYNVRVLNKTTIISDNGSRKTRNEYEYKYQQKEDYNPNSEEPEINKQTDLNFEGEASNAGVPRTVTASKAFRNRIASNVAIPPGLQSTSADAAYYKFVWKRDKPKPAKKLIVPGIRFDPPKLGEFGKKVNIKPEDLNTQQHKRFKDGWRDFQFNEYASLQISTQRQTPEYRPNGCINKIYSSHLQRASIIICFFNEAWSVLLRTIHSVLNRSPPELIEEIILVDDKSDMVKMNKQLEHYVTQVNKLRLIRMTKRSGLVRSRLAGVKEAKGPIIIFLDSHVECEEGWLPPLLHTILENPKCAVTPEIDIIDQEDFSIQSANNNIGILEFESFGFNWAFALPRIVNTRKSESDPVKSPTMAGGLFAIRKDYFISIGTYDKGLEVWGGENIELSLKLWMCGGGILIHPCSRVAHIFRDNSPYLTDNTMPLLSRNSARVAQVWADEYRDVYFKGKHYDEKMYGSVRETQELRERLQCRSFSWYVENIYPEMYIAGTGRYLGEIESVTSLCIHKVGTLEDVFLTLEDCSKAHQWESTRIKEIRLSDLCMTTTFEGNSGILLQKCNFENKSQTFEYLESTCMQVKDSMSNEIKSVTTLNQ